MKWKYIFALFLLFSLPLLTHAAYSGDFQKGYNFPSWWFDSYTQTWSDDSFKELLSYKPGWIAVGPFWYQKDKYATTIYANAKRTASDAAVEHIIKLAHDNGVKVMLKPLVDAEGGDWRGGFKPKDVNAWFASYTAMAVHYAKMAERLKVASYEFGGEYVALSSAAYSEKWRDVVAAIRKEYSGQIGYGANWDNQKGTPEFELENWLDAVDFIGIHAYFPLSKTNDATLDDMVKGVEPWVARVQVVQEKYQKPVIFTEAGYKSCDGGTRIPWWCNPNAGVDLQEQSDGTEAILRAFHDKPWFKGIFWWMWNQKPWHGGANDKDHNMNRKPVMDVITKYWNTSTGGEQVAQFPQPIVPPSAPLEKMTVPAPSPTSIPFSAPVPSGFTPVLPLLKMRTLFAAEAPQAPLFTAPDRPLFYGVPQKPRIEEKAAEKRMWNAVGKSFGWRKPKLKPGEWTVALRAYIYGGYPVDVVRDFLHHKRSAIIDVTKSWKELQASIKTP